MAKVKVEVCETKAAAGQRALILKERGWTVESPRAVAAVFWVNHCPGGTIDTATDADEEVWVVIASK